jgi:hypothetical protein
MAYQASVLQTAVPRPPRLNTLVTCLVSTLNEADRSLRERRLERPKERADDERLDREKPLSRAMTLPPAAIPRRGG